MRVLTHDQNSAEWLHARTSRITASRICDVLSFNLPSAAQAKEAGFKLVAEAVAAGVTGKESAARRGYRDELVGERLTGLAEPHFVSPFMDWGTETEPMARAEYEVRTGLMVDKVGFVLHEKFDFSGASVDGLVDPDGIIEIKCGKTTTHLRWMQAGVVPDEHRAQMIWGMVCTGRKWADFVSFDPRLPERLQLFIVRLELDQTEAEAMEDAVLKFEAEILESIVALDKLSAPAKEKPGISSEFAADRAELADDVDWIMRKQGLIK
jgi:predicted phage-related endonuclease